MGAKKMRGNGSNGRNRLAGAAIRFQPDSRLVRLVREGHDLAFEEIVRRYRSQLVAFAGAIVPRDHAEDVVQESLAKAHRALGRDAAEVKLRPWLYTIVRNRALNALRDEPTYEHLDENFDGVPQPPDVAARREELAAVIAGVQSLPGPQREALVSRALEGRSHAEIAASLGTTPGAVRGLIYRARTTLRDGVGLLIPIPVLRALLGSASMGSDAANAGGAAAAGLAAGGGGVALKAGATLGVAVIAVGSGLAIQHRGSKSDQSQAGDQARAGEVARAARLGSALAGGRHVELVADSGRGGPGSGSGDSDDHGDDSGPGSSSGPGSGSGSSGEGSASGGSGGGGEHSGTSGDDGSGSGTTDDGGGGSSGSGDDGSGSGSGTSGSGGTDDGGGGGSGSGGGETTSTDDGGGGGDSGPGGGGDVSTTTTTTTTTSGDGGEGPG
jgi:RNA polymerase sigma factor (sigma-70 family)